MSLSQENFRNNSSVRFNKIDGLESFKNNLEKHFFCQVIIRDYSVNSTHAKLVLELNCNFGLTEMLRHLNLGTWGNFSSENLCFSQLLKELREQNDFPIQIEEFSLYLKDTSIVINKIFEESIPEQLEAILNSVSENYVHFTKGLSEIPYEIYVPVFEECLFEKDSTLTNIKSGNNNVQDYYKYWGLYFYSEDDVLIYDLKNTAIVSGELQMLNL